MHEMPSQINLESCSIGTDGNQQWKIVPKIELKKLQKQHTRSVVECELKALMPSQN